MGLSLLAGGGPPCSPWVVCEVRCPVWFQLWLLGWLSVRARLSSGRSGIKTEVEHKVIHILIRLSSYVFFLFYSGLSITLCEHFGR